uniref:hypothetical protein n=1 Tax=Acetatifactor sp. TaxID=1872090 RepID=UPI004056F262
MKSNSFDKTGLVIGLLVSTVGAFEDPLIMILGGLMVATGILAYVVEGYKARMHMDEEAAEEVFFEEVVHQASQVTIR